MTHTLSTHHRQSYGKWGGNPRGTRADPARCAESVTPNERFAIPHQCRKARGYGPDEAFCKQHDPAARAKAYADKRRDEKLRHFRTAGSDALVTALQAIADGNNDPRTLARETLAAWREAHDFNPERS